MCSPKSSASWWSCKSLHRQRFDNSGPAMARFSFLPRPVVSFALRGVDPVVNFGDMTCGHRRCFAKIYYGVDFIASWADSSLHMDTTTLTIIGIIIVYALSSLRVLRQYERGVVFTLGKFTGIREPGLRFVFVPFQSMVRVSLRTVTMQIASQKIITRDNVS